MFNSMAGDQHRSIQAQSLTVTPLTVTVGYSDTLGESQTITNRFHAVTVTKTLLQ